MLALYPRAPGEVGDRARDAENAVVAARGEIHALKRGAHKLLPLGAHGADLAQCAAGDMRVAHRAVVGIALALDAPCGVHTLFYLRGALRRGAPLQLLIVQRRDLDDEVYPVEQRAGYARMIAAHIVRRAAAAPGRVPVPPALARVHRAHQHKPARERQRPRDARHRHHPVLKRLAQHLQRVAPELRQLVEKEHTVMRKADLPRARRCAAAGQPRGGHRVVRRAERPPGDDRVLAAREPGDGVYLRRLYHLLAAHVRQDAGQALCHHGLACAGRSDDEDVMSARSRDLERALDVLLSLDVGKIRHRCPRRVELGALRALYKLLPGQMRRQLGDSLHRVHRKPVGKRRLARVLRRDEEMLHPRALRRQRHRQRARDRAHLPRQRQLTDERALLPRRFDVAGGGEYAHEHRQVVHRSGLFLVRRGEVDCHAADREGKAAVFYRGAHTLARLLHRRIGQTHDVERRQPAGDINLHRHLVPADAGHAHALC